MSEDYPYDVPDMSIEDARRALREGSLDQCLHDACVRLDLAQLRHLLKGEFEKPHEYKIHIEKGIVDIHVSNGWAGPHIEVMITTLSRQTGGFNRSLTAKHLVDHKLVVKILLPILSTKTKELLNARATKTK